MPSHFSFTLSGTTVVLNVSRSFGSPLYFTQSSYGTEGWISTLHYTWTSSRTLIDILSFFSCFVTGRSKEWLLFIIFYLLHLHQLVSYRCPLIVKATQKMFISFFLKHFFFITYSILYITEKSFFLFNHFKTVFYVHTYY